MPVGTTCSSSLVPSTWIVSDGVAWEMTGAIVVRINRHVAWPAYDSVYHLLSWLCILSAIPSEEHFIMQLGNNEFLFVIGILTNG